VLSGSFRAKGDVLLFDDNGQHPGLDAAEVLARAGADIEFVTPERMLAPDVGGVNYPGYFKVFAEHDVRVTLNERLTAVRRKDGRLEVDLYNDTHSSPGNTVDQWSSNTVRRPQTSCTSRWCPVHPTPAKWITGAAGSRPQGAAQSGRPLSAVPHWRCGGQPQHSRRCVRRIPAVPGAVSA
jgi:hypothetical protein